MARHHPDILFERYADDVLFHCKTKWRAELILSSLRDRLKECRLELHPEKTKIIYCKNSNRKANHEWIAFDFLGFTFRPRKAMAKNRRIFTGFTPAISQKSLKRISKTIRSWKLQRWSGQSIDSIAEALNPVISGWLNYYRHFGRGALYKVSNMLDFALIRWARKKFKRMKRSYRKSKRYLRRLRKQQPQPFAHWRFSNG
jgi:RNA-directed DNA polymerase